MAQKPKNEEKFYTAKEVAIAVLKKAEELLKASKLAKANTSHEIELGEEPNNDDAEAPEYLADADIEDSGAHGEKKNKKKGVPGMEAADQDGDGDVDGDDAMDMADKDGDGDVDGDDAMEAAEEATGEDLDGDDEAGEAPEHKAKIKAASDKAPKAEEDKKPEEKVKDATKDKKPAFLKSEMDKCGDMNVVKGKKDEPKTKNLKKFMLQRKMKKAGTMTSDARAAEKMSGAAPQPAPAEKIKEQPSPAEKIKDQPKLQMEKNKATEKMLGIKPKAGK